MTDGIQDNAPSLECPLPTSSAPTSGSFLTQEGLRKAFREIAAEKSDVEQVLWVVYSFLHLLDDLYDRDKQPTPAAIAIVVCSFAETVAGNQFFQDHRAALLGSLRSAFVAWVGSERPTIPDGAPEGWATILKSHYQEMFWLIASLAGGLDHGLRMAEKYRGYSAG